MFRQFLAATVATLVLFVGLHPLHAQEKSAPATAPAAEKTAFLGITTSEVPEILRAQLNLPKGFGMVIDSVQPGSPAELAGLKKFDVLHKVNDQIVINQEQLAVLVTSYKPGDSIQITVIHQAQPTNLSVKLAERPAALAVVAEMEADGKKGPEKAFRFSMPFTLNGKFASGNVVARENDQDNDHPMNRRDGMHGNGMPHERMRHGFGGRGGMHAGGMRDGGFRPQGMGQHQGFGHGFFGHGFSQYGNFERMGGHWNHATTGHQGFGPHGQFNARHDFPNHGFWDRQANPGERVGERHFQPNHFQRGEQDEQGWRNNGEQWREGGRDQRFGPPDEERSERNAPAEHGRRNMDPGDEQFGTDEHDDAREAHGNHGGLRNPDGEYPDRDSHDGDRNGDTRDGGMRGGGNNDGGNRPFGPFRGGGFMFHGPGPHPHPESTHPANPATQPAP